jgi:F-type H+-transporting ATPase subunit b
MHNAFVRAAETQSLLLPTWPDLIWGTLAFAIILFFVIWKLVPAMNKTLDARREAIEGGLQKAELAQAEAKQAQEKYTDQLAEARAEAASIREQARLDATVIANEVKAQATVDAARITATAQAQIEAERQSAFVTLRNEVGMLAVDLASGVVGESLTDDKKAAAVVDRFLAELESSEKASN